MIVRIAAAVLLLAAPVFAQTAPPAVPATPTPAATVRVVLTTELGPVVLALEKERAPVTVANFLRYVNAKRFDGIAFYRAMTVGPGLGLVQAGQRDGGKQYPGIAHEATSATGLKHMDGTISMARGAPGSAAGDWFIMVGDAPYLDANPAAPGDNLGYAAFGRVVEGMDVVRRIHAAPVDPAKGEGAMKGQMIAAPVKVVTARVAE